MNTEMMKLAEATLKLPEEDRAATIARLIEAAFISGIFLAAEMVGANPLVIWDKAKTKYSVGVK